jgi:hypothetical protein
MRPNPSRRSAALVLLLGAVFLQAQTTENETLAPPVSKPQFFSGNVTQVDHEEITVSRSLVGKGTETRTFLIKPETKISKSVKAKTRVTVRYQHLPEGDIALEVQVRWRTPRI